MPLSFSTHRTVDRFAVALSILSACVWGVACTRAKVQTCSPFGDPPATLVANIIPKCAKGVRLGPWRDSDGTDRYACRYAPPQASASKPLPLVVYLHPSLLSADSVENWTNLLDSLATANLSDDPARPGFILLAPEGRNTHHYYAPPDATGPGWDNWYRQFNPAGDVTRDNKLFRENVDAATIDHFIRKRSGGRRNRPESHLSQRMVEWRRDGIRLRPEPPNDRGDRRLFRT